MSYAPPIPPLPQDFYSQQQPPPSRQHDSKPPLPPLPPNFRPEQNLASPMPERVMPSLPADMARTLDESVSHRQSSLHPSQYGYPGPDPFRRQSPAPPPPGPVYPPGPGYPGGFVANRQPAYAQPYPPPRVSSAQPYPQPQPRQSPPQPAQSPGRLPDLTAHLPTLDSLLAGQRALSPRPAIDHIPWIRDVLFLVDRVVAQNNAGSPNQTPEGAVSLSDPTLARLANDALSTLLVITNTPGVPPPPEALYLRASLHSSGAFPAHVPHSPRDAFRDFETAARAGFSKAWFKLGRDYEGVGDLQRARDCFERGLRAGVESCFYRLGMAHLLGQLGLPATPQEALPLLHRAATLATIDVPQPAYVYGLLLLGEFNNVRLDERFFAPLIPAGSSPGLEARKFVERAAYLGFAPAQYKLGHAYEYAVPPFPFDPLLSVQYYSLASQQGEPEADMALSKWFLCGAEGAFEKDESLAWTFADKAARKGLGSAEFAMGYYAEVGVGGRKDVDAARRWYAKAVDHGNADAPERLAALSQPTPQALSRREHDAITDAKLVRKHTQARVSAQAEGRVVQAREGAGREGVIGRIRGHAQAQQQAQAHPQPQTRYSLVDSGGGAPPPPQGTVGLPSSPAQGHGASSPGQGTPSSSPPRSAGRPPGRRPHTASPGLPPGAASPRTGTGAGAGAPGSGAASPAPGSGLAPAQTPTPTPGHSGSRPTTFAEMGFQSGKAADKECVVM